MTWPFGKLCPFGYGAIIVDPPWLFENWSAKGEGKNATAHYACADLDALKALPVGHLASRDCALFMWATWPMIDQALDLMQAWGFEYKSGGAWAKQSSTGNGWAFGTGYTFRGASEPFLLGTTGNPMVMSHSERNLIVAPVQEHSRKPDDAHRMIERMYQGPYAEIARRHYPNWACWGNELEKVEA